MRTTTVWCAVVCASCGGPLVACGSPTDGGSNDASLTEAGDAGVDVSPSEAGIDANVDAQDANLDAPTDASTDVAADGSGDASTCHLVINEVRTGDGVTTSNEYVELFNPCGASFTFPPNWYLVTYAPGDLSYSRVGPLTALTVSAGAYWLAVGTGYAYVPVANFTFPTANLIERSGGNVALGSFPAPSALDSAFVVVDAVRWGVGGTNALAEGNAAAVPTIAKSLARKPNGFDSNTNDIDFDGDATPSPKGIN